MMSHPGNTFSRSMRGRLLGICAMLLLGLGALHAPAAQAAHGGHGGGHSGGGHPGGGHWHGGHWRGGVFIGGPVFADPFWPGYWPDYYPPEAYVPPPEAYVEADPGALPKAAPAPQLSREQREQRLNDMCARHVFRAEECATRRAELLKEM
jgi:hypothetical protein